MKRLTPATLTVFMMGVVALLVLGYFAKNLWAQKEKPVVSTMRDVPMAITDIRSGTVITAEHLGKGRADRTKLTADVLLAERVIVGRVAREDIKVATPIRAGQLYQPGEQPPLDIGPNMRAISIEVGDGVAVVDGLIKPGDAVDVLFTSQGASGGTSDNTYQGGLTMRLFEGVKVLAINRNFSQGKVDRGNNHVTLELSVAQANIIVLAKDRGKITLTYNPNGKGHGGLALSNSERVTLFEILGLEKSDPIREPFVTEIFRGHNRTKNQFDDRGRLIDSWNRNQNDQNQNTQYQLPNSNPSNRNSSSSTSAPSSTPTFNQVPQPNVIQGRPINQSIPALNDRVETKNAPTAQLLQPLN